MRDASNKDYETLQALEAALLVAHEGGHQGELIALYTKAGALKEAQGDIDAACFYFTHAYVYALELGHGDKLALKEKLLAYGREE